MKLLLRLVLPAFVCLSCLSAFGQSREKVDSLIAAINGIRERMPIEKLYLQTDKENYIQGDTIWFKAYLLDGSYLMPSLRSGLLYAEIEDSDNNCVKRILLPLKYGLTWGNIELNEKDIPEGSYTLRAYTNWMRNFGEDYVFRKNIYVASSGKQSTLVVAGFKETNNIVQANIMLTDLESRPLRLRDIELKGVNGKQTLFKKNMSTGVDGRVDVSFTIPPNKSVRNISLIANDLHKGKETAGLIIPVTLTRPENTDLQFMPEGGSLISGINTRIGFKAIGEDGKGVDVSGKVYNSKQQEVASFSSAYKGIGAFDFLPQAGEVYSARLNPPNGATKTYPLPTVNPSGTGIKVRLKGDDSIEVTVSAKGIAPADYYLTGQSRDVVCYAAHFTLNDKSVKVMAKSLFPTGIARFTLLNAEKKPLNERIVYIDRQDNLKVNIATDAPTYARRDSIALNIQVTDKTGKPVSGSFSLAVTDASQVKADSLGSNILNNLLFTSELKGTVEEPGYYFAENTLARTTALDNLLLTQGWVNYPWADLTGLQVKPQFAAEPEFVVTGTVHNGFNKPLPGADIVLFSRKPVMAMDTVSNTDGKFTFKGFFPVDVAAYVIQAKRRKSGSNFNILINIDEFKPPVFRPSNFNTVPWYVNTDTLLLRNRDNKLSQHVAEEKARGNGTELKEVIIKDKRIIKDSKNLNGPGKADFILDEADMEKAGKRTLFDILEQRYKPIYVDGIGTNMVYRFKGHIIHLIIDGVFLDQLGLAVDTYMHYLTAEEIKGIEIMYTSAYASKYDPDFLAKQMGNDWYVPVYLEITTYNGNGAFLKKKDNLYIYKPLAFSLPKQFYRPRYTVKNNINGTDLRSTIHWEPNVVTDTTGKAVVSFYSADKAATYNIIVQGTDLNGRLGFTQRKIVIH